jgi:hypothetical protein
MKFNNANIESNQGYDSPSCPEVVLNMKNASVSPDYKTWSIVNTILAGICAPWG